MGFRYRKSINLGGGFRVNFSTSGIGYSFGGKGIRYTRTARGTNRVTLSIPGTGISWSQESKRGRNARTAVPRAKNENSLNSEQHLFSIESTDAEKLTSETKQEFISSVREYVSINGFLSLMIVLFIIMSIGTGFTQYTNTETVAGIRLSLVVFPIVVKLVYRYLGRIRIFYEYDEDGAAKRDNIYRIVECFSSCASLWQVNDVYANENRRTHAGTAQSISRKQIKIEKKKPYFLATNETCYYVKLKKEKLYILPDMVIFLSGKNVGAVDLSDISMKFGSTRFVEQGMGPSDAKIVDNTWKYVNNNGTPDRRYSGNRRLPVCLYATVDLSTNNGMNIQLQLSSMERANQLQAIIKKSKDKETPPATKDNPTETFISDEASRIILDGLRLWPERVQAFHQARTVEDFFEKYNQLCDYSDELLKSEKIYMEKYHSRAFDDETQKTLKRVRDTETLNNELRNFIDRSFKECYERIASLKTKKARKNNAMRWKNAFDPYREKISPSMAENIESKYNELVLECEKGH